MKVTSTLVLGGARSGKSAWAQGRAEAVARAAGRIPTMIVTAEAGDQEMGERIARHRADRADRWSTVEAPLDLTVVVARLGPSEIAVVDCLTLWLSNLMGTEADIDAETDRLVSAIAACPARLWLVSNEVGWGIVPDNALARRFRDHAGRLHQRLAAIAQDTVLIVAGLPLRLGDRVPRDF